MNGPKIQNHNGIKFWNTGGGSCYTAISGSGAKFWIKGSYGYFDVQNAKTREYIAEGLSTRKEALELLMQH